ncbi:MAG TPA: polyprenyl synthetase family protein, partial [Trinickia sp.]|nr:polyprenyl synthetase family protein [Trinickia sp.]
MSSTATSSPSAATLLAPIAEDMEQVNRVIRQRLASEVMLINQISEYIIGAGGKRLRPALLLLVARALGDTTGYRHELAAVVEFIHT